MDTDAGSDSGEQAVNDCATGLRALVLRLQRLCDLGVLDCEQTGSEHEH